MALWQRFPLAVRAGRQARVKNMFSKRLERQRPKLISFSGIDGAGKSTQIDSLRAHLTVIGMRVHVVTFWEEIATLTRLREATGYKLFKGDKGVGTPTKPVNRRDKNVQSWYMTAFRFFLYLSDAISLRLVVAKLLKSPADVVIFDRYLYDELANLQSPNGIVRLYVRLLRMLTPRPDISYLLDADPVHARARKPEYPLEFLHRSRASYMALSKLVEMTLIAPQPMQDATQSVIREFTMRIAAVPGKARGTDLCPAGSHQ